MYFKFDFIIHMLNQQIRLHGRQHGQIANETADQADHPAGQDLSRQIGRNAERGEGQELRSAAIFVAQKIPGTQS